MNTKAMSFTMPDLSSITQSVLASIGLVFTTYFVTKSKLNKDKVESADSTAKVDAIAEWKAIALSKDDQIKMLVEQNNSLMNRNQELYSDNQKLKYNIGDLKNQLEALTKEVHSLRQQMGGRRSTDIENEKR